MNKEVKRIAALFNQQHFRYLSERTGCHFTQVNTGCDRVAILIRSGPCRFVAPRRHFSIDECGYEMSGYIEDL